jgi:hypothetical protein
LQQLDELNFGIQFVTAYHMLTKSNTNLFWSLKHVFLAALFIISTVGKVQAQTDGTNPQAKPFLYALQKDGKTSYILGSVHVGVSLNQFPEFVSDAIKSKKTIIGEQSIDDAFKIDYHYQSKNEIPEELRQKLLIRGLPEYFVDFGSTQQLCSKYMDWDLIKDERFKEISLDAQIQILGRKLNKKFVALDTNKSLLDLIEKEEPCTLKDLSKFVVDYPPETVTESVNENLKLLAPVYLNGSEFILTDGASEESPSTYLRNEYWMKALTKLHSDSYFAVVGMSHLAPNHAQGLLPLFKKAGFTVTRVTADNYLNFK